VELSLHPRRLHGDHSDLLTLFKHFLCTVHSECACVRYLNTFCVLYTVSVPACVIQDLGTGAPTGRYSYQ